MYVQAERPMTLTTPLGPDKFILISFTGREAISQLFHFHLDLASQEEVISFNELLGQKVTVEWKLRDDEKRYFNGIVKRISQGERTNIFTRYSMEIVPQLWILSKKAQSRIFQHISVPEILKKVFEGLDVSYEIMGTFQPRDYCAQYRESDFHFASRLMEEEGLYYFFKHNAGGHTMVVANTPQSHPDAPGDVIYEETIGGMRDEDRVWAWEKTQELRSGKYTLWDHCFELPGKHLQADKTTLESVQIGQNTHKLKVGGNDKLEMYDYPGGYAQRFDGVDKSGGEQAGDIQKIFEDNKRTVEIRMQAETTPAVIVEGAGNCDAFVSGYKFNFTRHFSDNGKYLLTSVDHHCAQPLGSGRDTEGAFTYENRFTAIPAAVPYRPSRVTPVPTVQGTQTATVVGPAGEEIFTDKYGRIKVQFHWDREGKNDIDSSCWLRVATLWAGKQWGIVHIPRIGQEVIVDFLEGHPDQPIVIGSVYNADQMPPYTLPDNKTQSGIKSRSSKGGGTDNFNEMRFEDKKGQELVFVHAEKDLTTEVEHDEKRDVGNDRTTDIHRDETKTVDRDQTLTVKRNRTATVEGDDKETVNGKQEITIGKNQTVQIGSDQKITVGGGLTITISSSESSTVGSSRSATVASSDSLNVGSSRTVNIASSDSLTAGSSITITGGAGVTITGGGGVKIVSGAPLQITAPMVTMATAMLQVAGVVQCTSVISPTYTPGAGNIL